MPRDIFVWSEERRKYKEILFNKYINARFRNDYIRMFKCEISKWNKMRKHSHTRLWRNLYKRFRKQQIPRGKNGRVPHHWEQNWDVSILKLLEAYETGPSQVAVTPVRMGNYNQGREILSRMD